MSKNTGTRRAPCQKTILGALAVALVLAGVLGATQLLQNAADSRLFAAVHTRPLGTRELDPGTAQWPLVQALWDKAQYYDETGLAFDDYEKNEVQRLPMGQAYYQTKLYKAGVFPRMPAVQDKAADGTALVLGTDFLQMGSVTLYQNVVISAGIELPMDTPPPDLAAACRHYVEYLGLEQLGDWQPAQLFESSSMQTAGLYSSRAQLLVQVVWDHRYEDYILMSCMAISMPRDVFAQQNTAGLCETRGGATA